MRIQYSEPADVDLANIKRYYAEQAGTDFAEGQTNRIIHTFEGLVARHPRAGRLRPELVYVLRILHGRRNIQRPLASLLTAM